MKVGIICNNSKLKGSLGRYFHYVLGHDVNDSGNPLPIFDLTGDEEDIKKQIEELMGVKSGKILPILILNPETTLKQRFKEKQGPNLFALTEIFHEYFNHISIPEELNRIKDFYQDIVSYDNPFVGFGSKISDIRRYLLDTFEMEEKEKVEEETTDVFYNIGEWIFADTRKEKRLGVEHGEEIKDFATRKVKMWYYYLLLFYLFRKREVNKDFKILWIENNPTRELKDVGINFVDEGNRGPTIKNLAEKISEWFGVNIHIITKGFQKFHKEILKYREKSKSGKNEDINSDAKDEMRGEEEIQIQAINNEETCNLIEEQQDGSQLVNFEKLDDYSFVLIDIFLEEKDGLDGVDFVKAFSSVFPHIPVFILSMCEDYETIWEGINGGADYYILKQDFLTFPLAYYLHQREIGKSVDFINNEKLKKSIKGNIRYWNFKKKHLWFGDKCYHMVGHSFEHTKEDWELINDFLYPLLKYNKIILSDEMLYAFMMGVWLHDIGHKGNRKYGEPHQIRNNHGYISAEYILKYPNIHGIVDRDDYYQLLDFSKEAVGSAVEVLYDRVREKKSISITEMSALLAMYHKSNCPLDKEDYYKLVSKGKHIPPEYFKNGIRNKDNIITLSRILDGVSDNIKDNLIKLVLLFRFIDAMDISKNRVGDSTEKALKMKVIEDDKLFLINKIRREAKRIHKKEDSESVWAKIFVKDVIDKVESGKKVTLKGLQEYLEEPEEYENYMSLVNFASFVGVQPDHFALHSSVESIKINYDGHFKIEVKLNKTQDELKDIPVQEFGRENESLLDRIIGNEDKPSYFYRELTTGWKYLKEIFAIIPEIIVKYRDGKEDKAILFED